MQMIEQMIVKYWGEISRYIRCNLYCTSLAVYSASHFCSSNLSFFLQSWSISSDYAITDHLELVSIWFYLSMFEIDSSPNVAYIHWVNSDTNSGIGCYWPITTSATWFQFWKGSGTPTTNSIQHNYIPSTRIPLYLNIKRAFNTHYSLFNYPFITGSSINLRPEDWKLKPGQSASQTRTRSSGRRKGELH